MQYFFAIATTIAIALLNINDDKQECNSSITNYSSATDVLAKLIFQNHCDQISIVFQTFSGSTPNFRPFQSLFFILHFSGLCRTFQDPWEPC